MRFLNQDVNSTSLLSAVVATKIGGDIVASLVGNDLSSAVDGKEVAGETVYSSIASVIANQHPAAVLTTDIAISDEPVSSSEYLFSGIGKSVIKLSFDKKGFIPHVNTPLAAYLAPMQSIKLDDINGTINLDNVLNERHLQNNIAELVDGGTKGVGSLISVCRNEVLPAIRTVLTHASKILGERQREISFPFTIVQDDVPALWRDTSFVAALDKGEWNTSSYERVTPLMGITSEGLDFQSMLLTGVSHLDDIIKDTVINSPDISWVWRVISRQGNKPFAQLLTTDPDGIITTENRRKYLTIAYLLARHVLAVGVDILKPTEPVLAKEHFTVLVRVLGQSIIRNMNLYDKIAKNDWIIDRAFEQRGITNIVVHGDNYRKWLLSNEANSPEILYSSFDMLGTRREMADIDAKRVQLATNWNRLFAISENKRIQREREIVGYAVNVAVTTYINDIANGQQENVSLFKNRLKEVIADEQYNGVNDLPFIVRDVVCGVFYANTDAITFLKIYDRLGAQYTNYDPRTVATIATIEYVGKWVAKQLVVISL